MNPETCGSEILEQYRSISQKLKKRFLRKPNITEACESFSSLGQHCENTEMPSYAGLCWIAAARCEGSLGNITGETSCLVRSARQFLSAEFKNNAINCPSPSGENVQAALSCYTHAISRYPENSPLATCLNLEIVESLKKLNKIESVEAYLKNAVSLSGEESLDTRIFCLRQLAGYYVENGNYFSALEIFTNISDLIQISPNNSARNEVLLNCEIHRVFLLLILKPAPQTLPSNLIQILEKYTWGDESDKSIRDCGMSDKLFLLLQSLVLTCQSADTTSLPNLEGQLWFLLSNEQRDLLRILVQCY